MKIKAKINKHKHRRIRVRIRMLQQEFLDMLAQLRGIESIDYGTPLGDLMAKFEDFKDKRID